MPQHSPRRSTRRKRPPPAREAPPPPPELPPRPASKKRKATRNADETPPSAPSPPSYKPTRETLFLGLDFRTIHLNPPFVSCKQHEDCARYMEQYKNDVHAYFTSKRAPKFAADSHVNLYRHIGHLTMENFRYLHGTPSGDEWFASVRSAPSDALINMRDALDVCMFSNTTMARPLESLTTEQDEPWNAPFILLVAERKHVMKACRAARNSPINLNVQVYVSRLLFEIIACRDIRVLFEEVVPSIPFKPVPTVPNHPAVFQRSPPPTNQTRGFASMLRDAESTGYSELTPEQRAKIENTLTVKLYPYQEQTVRWMLDKEDSPHSLNEEFWEEHFFTDTAHAKGGSFFYFPLSGEVRLVRPPNVRGGMIAEEMGLGKTVEALAVIACQKTERQPEEVQVWCEEQPDDVDVEGNRIKLTRLRTANVEKRNSYSSSFQHDDEILEEDVSEIEFPCAVRVRRWPAATTLVVCPDSLLGQWKQEVLKRTPSLSVFVWPPPKELGRDGGTDVGIGENAKDIVLATYDMVRNDPRLSKICWRRVILDESQVTRRSAALVAKDVFNLRCSTRFLMTGTPLVTSINDLKGQLACLKVWPFSLEQDGFWEAYISYPFSLGCEVPQLKQLLSHTMIRHSKAQNLNLSLPPRRYQTIRVDLSGSHRACYYYVLGSCLNEIEAQNPLCIDTRRIRPLLRLLVGICLSPELLDAVALDLARRFTWSRRNPSVKSSALSLQLMDPQEAIRFVAESSEGMVHHSNRVFAASSSKRESDPELKKFYDMTLQELREHVVKNELLEADRAKRVGRDRLASLAAGGIHRVYTDTVAELRATAERLKLGHRDEVATWPKAKVKARLIMHYDVEKGIQLCRTVHESGYLALSKLIEKKGNPSCPVCLMEIDGRITITKCGHMYCHDCILVLLGHALGQARCAICRRSLPAQSVVEVSRPTDTKDEKQTDEKDKEHLVETVNAYLSAVDGGAGASDGACEELDMNFETVENSELNISRPNAREAWEAYEEVGLARQAYRSIGRNERYPSLEPEILQHISAAHSIEAAPKMMALLQLIRTSSDDTKFCVVAGTVENLKLIHEFLNKHQVKSVGVGQTTFEGGDSRRCMASAAERFSCDASVRVFLLNPTNAAGLTLTAANVVVFMETLVRVADEIQAAARVHRIGQTKEVRIVRIVARGTIEENIVAQRGEIRSAAEESRALATVSSQEASDRLILQLFRPERDDSASQGSGDISSDDESDDFDDFTDSSSISD